MSTVCQKALESLKVKNKDFLPLMSCINALEIQEKDLEGGKVFILTVSSLFFKERVESKLLASLEQELRYLLKTPFKIKFNISGKKTSLPKPPKPLPSPQIKKKRTFNPSYTFDSFILGCSDENNLAFYTAKTLAQSPLNNPNSPFFIYGNSGLGKTHLLHAIGNKVSLPSQRVSYLSAERFLYECVASIREKQMDKFKKKYREEPLVLLIDDIQSIEKAPASQEEFFHTFNAIHERGGLIICTCDRPPEALKGLQKRIQTRLLSGIFAQIEAPHLETKLAILQKKSQDKNINLSSDILLYLAQKPSSSVRELEGFLNKIKMVIEIQKNKLSLTDVRSLFKEKNKNPKLKIQEVIKDVALSYQVTPAQLCSSQRAKHIVQARKTAIKTIRQLFPHLSLSEIGRIFGGKSHSTILHHLKK